MEYARCEKLPELLRQRFPAKQRIVAPGMGSATQLPHQQPKDIQVEIESPKVSFAGDNKATVVFRQIYHSGSVKQDNRKTLLLAKRGDAWRIVRESADN